MLQEGFANSGLVLQESELVEDTELQTLPFLKARLLEALRIHHPVHLLGARLTTEEEVSLLAYRIPVGTGVILDYKACINAACFGSIVHSFQPERWMTDDLEKRTDMQRHVDIVWNKAPSQLLTIDIACMQLRKLILGVSS